MTAMPVVLLILNLILVILMGSCPQPATSPDTSWFVVTWPRLDDANVNLPPEVTLGQEGGHLLIINTTPTPLYILGTKKTKRSYDIPVKVPPLTPEWIFVDGEAYWWHPDKEDWVLQSSASPEHPYRWSWTNWIREYEISEQIPTSPDRPADVSVPEPISRTIYLVYDTQIIRLPMQVGFALNPNYMREPPPQPPVQCTSPLEVMFKIAVIGLLLLSALTWFAIRLYRSRRVI